MADEYCVSIRLFSCMTQCRTTTAATERAAAIIHIFMCWSTQILDAMNQDSRVPLTQLQVDGGMTSNRLLMQLQADILCTTVGKHVHTRSGRRCSTKPLRSVSIEVSWEFVGHSVLILSDLDQARVFEVVSPSETI